ncbi:hypothetical protein KXR87_02855 [Yokenella regensburgei]|uniref:hypothetical protein n=1 Tax=Yokenella regensburgei TaxID=158877 RepID=UPI003F13AEEC
MTVYVFYYNDSCARVFTKESVDKDAAALLKRHGYKKHHFEAEAESAASAIEMLKNSDDSYLNELKEYSENILFVSMVGLATMW